MYSVRSSEVGVGRVRLSRALAVNGKSRSAETKPSDNPDKGGGVFLTTLSTT